MLPPSAGDSARQMVPERARVSADKEVEQLSQQVGRLSEQNQSLKSSVIKLCNSLNASMTKTLIEPLNNAVPLLVQQVAAACDLDLTDLDRQARYQLQPDSINSADQLLQKVSKTTQRVQSLHSTLLSASSLLKVVQLFNSRSNLAPNEMIFTVDDLRRKLGILGVANNSSARVHYQQPNPRRNELRRGR